MMRKLLFLFALLVSTSMAWADEWTSGSCTVTLSNGTLTVSGTGAMADYNITPYSNTAPWYSSRTYITSIVISEGVTHIGDYAFHECTNASLSSITIPESMTSIGQYAFYSTCLASVTIPASVTNIGESAFNNCSNLTSVTFANGSKLGSIGPSAFSYTGLTSVTIPSGVTSIGNYAFSCCTSLASVTIPSSVTSIGTNAFYGCTNCANVYCYANPTDLTWNEGDCNDFKSAKATNCHVFNASDFKTKWSTDESSTDVNVTFVTDLTSTVATHAADGAYWATYYNSLGNLLAPEGVTVYKGTVSGTNLTLTEISDRIITAGQGVVLKKTAEGSITLTATETTPAGSYSGNNLTGVDAATTKTAYTTAHPEALVYYTLAGEEGNLGFYQYTGTTLGANKAFLPLNAAVSAREFYLFDLDNEMTTGVEKVERSELKVDSYYNLNGQRVNKPTKGLYIVGGRKVLVP